MPKKTELSAEDKELRERIGIAIRQISSASNLKPQDIARIGGVSLAHQYRVESGETTPDAIYLFKVASHLGVPLSRFFEKAESPAMRASVASSSGQSVVGDNAIQIGSVAGKARVKNR